MNKFATILAGAGLALATLGGALVGTAEAATPPGGTHGGPGDTADPGPRHNTGSANLDKLANALALYNRSVTAVVRAPIGLKLTRPVEVVGIFGTNADHVTKLYSERGGLRMDYDFPAGDGKPRREPVVITLTERDPLSNRVLASYVIRTGADIEALWSVIVNPLRIFFLDPFCDTVSDTDAHIMWYDANGVEHDRELNPGLGETLTISDGFTGIWHEVKASDPLFQPSIVWHEHDGPFVNFHPPAPSNSSRPLLPTEDQQNRLVLTEEGGDCVAQFDYSVRVVLRSYPGLPNT
jgi:hypothetical protein